MSTESMGKYRVAAWSVLLLVVLVACVEAPPPPPPDVIVQPPDVIVTQYDGETVIFEDMFATRKDDWQQVRGFWAVENGEMRQKRDDPREGNSLMVIYGYEITDAEIVTKVASYGGTSAVSGAGIVFRLKDADNYYMFRLVAGNRVVLGKMIDNQWFDLDNLRAADFRVDGKLRPVEEIRVRISGNRIQCWVGEDSVINRVDDQFTTGKVGLATFKATASFDYIRIVEAQTRRRPTRPPEDQ